MIRPDSSASDARAKEIFQSFLDVTSRHVFDGNAEAYSEHVSLPYVFRTAAGEQVSETMADLAGDIDRISTWMELHSVTDYYRIARRARFLGKDMIEGFHVSYVLRGAIPVIEPYANRVILRLGDDRWHATYSEHEVADALFPMHFTRAAPGAFSDEWRADAGQTDLNQSQAMPVYQGRIDAMSRAVETDDFDGWMALFTLPYHVHYDSVDHLVEGPDDVWPFFDMMRSSMADIGADSLARTATYATFVADDRLLGYHDTVMAKDGKPLFGPIKSRMTMTRDDGDWKCDTVTNSLSNTGLPGGQFLPTPALPTLREIQERMKK